MDVRVVPHVIFSLWSGLPDLLQFFFFFAIEDEWQTITPSALMINSEVFLADGGNLLL